MPHVSTRWMVRRDLPEVLEIERASFAPAYVWGEAGFSERLRHRDCIGLVADHGRIVVGYVVYLFSKVRFHVVRLAVHPDHRRQGVGRAILAKLLQKVGPRPVLTTFVGERNLDAQLFLRACGWKAYAVIPEHFDAAPGEAAYQFEFWVPARTPTEAHR